MTAFSVVLDLVVSLQAEPLRKWTVLSGLLGKLLLDDKSLLRRHGEL